MDDHGIVIASNEINFEALKGYQPKGDDNDFSPIKGEVVCKINYARVEPYGGQMEELKGCEFLSVELEVVEGEFAGRRLWKRFNLSSQKEDGKGKTPIQKLADYIFKVGLEFKDMASLLVCLRRFSEMVLDVKAYTFNGKNKNGEVEVIQQHTIKGIYQHGGSVKSGTIPF